MVQVDTNWYRRIRGKERSKERGWVGRKEKEQRRGESYKAEEQKRASEEGNYTTKREQ